MSKAKPRKTFIEMYSLGCSVLSLPLPEPLTDMEIIEQVSELYEDCFTNAKGKAQYRQFADDGYKLLGWPDGTRLAYRKRGGKNLTPVEGVACYRRARRQIKEETLKLLAKPTASEAAH